MERDYDVYRLAAKSNWRKITLAIGFYGIPIALGLAAYLIFVKRSNQKRQGGNRPRERLSKRIKTGIPPGLVNLGNNCFMNSLLQSLASLTSFCNWLGKLETQKDRILLDSLKNILEVLNNKRDIDRDVFSANDVLESLSAHGWFISSQQQDTHEFFQILMATLDDEIGSSKAKQSVLDCKNLEFEEQQTLINRFSHSDPNKKTALQSPFKGMLANRMTCNTCGYKSVRFEPCESVSVRIPRNTALTGLTLERCLADFIRSEIVVDVNCPGCTKNCNSPTPIKSSFVKQLSFAKIPKCLCIHVQRTYFMSDGSSYKNGQFVRFTDILDLYPYRSMYRLKAVTVHIGDVSSGHFVTYKRAIDSVDRWVYVSDEYSKITTKQSVLSNTAYLLFYERINDVSDCTA